MIMLTGVDMIAYMHLVQLLSRCNSNQCNWMLQDKACIMPARASGPCR